MNLDLGGGMRAIFVTMILTFCAVALSAVEPGTAMAQDAKGERLPTANPTSVDGNVLPAWIVTCSNANPTADLGCIMQQSVHLQETGQRISAVTISKDAENFVAIIQLPHGINLPAGVQVSVDDGQAITLAIESADANGSYARLPIDKATNAALRAGTTLRIVATTMAGQQLNLELLLAGFSKSQDILLKSS